LFFKVLLFLFQQLDSLFNLIFYYLIIRNIKYWWGQSFSFVQRIRAHPTYDWFYYRLLSFQHFWWLCVVSFLLSICGSPYWLPSSFGLLAILHFRDKRCLSLNLLSILLEPSSRKSYNIWSRINTFWFLQSRHCLTIPFFLLFIRPWRQLLHLTMSCIWLV
jgi:hypothetical protein